MERYLSMPYDIKIEAKLCGYNALALHMATLGLQHILGGIPIWSNIDIDRDQCLDTDDSMTVVLRGNRIHVVGTRHFYKPTVQVGLVKNTDGYWQFRSMTVFLHHPRTSEVGVNNDIDTSLEPGIEMMTDFSSLQSDVDDPNLSYSVWLPPLTTHFTIPK